jgi:hypothetical protein
MYIYDFTCWRVIGEGTGDSWVGAAWILLTTFARGSERFFLPVPASSLCVTIQSMRRLSARSVSDVLLIAVLIMSSVGISFAQSGVPQGQDTVLDKDALRPVEEKGRWGFADVTGKLVITPRYFAAQSFHEGYSLVVTRKPWTPLGDEYGEFRLAQVTWVDTTGRQIRDPLSVRRASNFSDGLASVVPDTMMRFKGGCAKGGYIDTKGQWAIKPQFDGLSDFSEGLAAVNLGANCGMGGKWGFIDKSGTTVIPFRFLSAGQFQNGRACVWEERGKGEVIDRNGNTIPAEKRN